MSLVLALRSRILLLTLLLLLNIILVVVVVMVIVVGFARGHLDCYSFIYNTAYDTTLLPFTLLQFTDLKASMGNSTICIYT